MPTNRNLRSVAAALLSLAMALVLLAACPAEDHDLNAARFDTAAVAPTMAPGTAPPGPDLERRDSMRASRSRSAAVDAAAAAERRRILEAAKAKAEAAQREAAVALAPRPAATGDVWWALGNCESGNNPRSVGGGGRFFGAFQFTLGTWHGIGESGNPVDYPYDHQLAAAKRLQARSGWGQWPRCSRRLGLR